MFYLPNIISQNSFKRSKIGRNNPCDTNRIIIMSITEKINAGSEKAVNKAFEGSNSFKSLRISLRKIKVKAPKADPEIVAIPPNVHSIKTTCKSSKCTANHKCNNLIFSSIDP